MNISAIQAKVAASILNSQNTASYQAMQHNASQQIEDTFTESEETSQFREIVEKYDITNISRNEANQMYKELMDNGFLTFKDIAMVTFDPTRLPGWQDGISSFHGWNISSNPNQKMNYLEGLKTQAEYNRQYGNADFQANYDQAFELAEKIYYFQS